MLRGATVLLLGVLCATSAAADSGAAAVVEHLHATLLGAMKDAAALGYQGRYDRIKPAVDTSFDLDFMARFVLGPDGKDLSAADQARWRDAFERITVATYAGRFTGWGGEQFKTLGEEPAAQDTVFVKTVLDRPDAENVQLTYRLRQSDGGWKIVDIYNKGTVSELALRRSDYSSVLKRDGFDKLVQTVDAKVADYASGKITN
ncbi:ABC transporter substrate-binding protein [bacterium]|nr:ABC transporter substrate-binding protein [bacterium]